MIHDVKNLMCAVINTAELLTIEVPDGHPWCKKLGMIVRLTQQCIELLTSSQSVESGYSCDFKAIELIPLIDNVVSIIEFRKDNDIKVEVAYNGLHPVVSGNQIELESVLLNVCINAIEAMSGTGTLRIGVSSIEKHEKPDFYVPAGSLKQYVQIVISDTGAGIAPDKIPIIFNRFYTTKQTSGIPQRGMGLFRAKQCIYSHGGTIDVQSVLSQGTTFTILLPAMES
jgi:signal transduction histidine kinase